MWFSKQKECLYITPRRKKFIKGSWVLLKSSTEPRKKTELTERRERKLDEMDIILVKMCPGNVRRSKL